MSLERASELAKLIIDLTNGQVSAVTAQHLTGIKEDGRWVAGSGVYVDTPIAFDEPGGKALAGVLGEVNAGLIAQLADLAARVEVLENENEALTAELAE